MLEAGQFDTGQLSDLFEKAEAFQTDIKEAQTRRELASRYVGEVFVSLFYEPSTRTRLSFEVAAARFGMGIASTENAREFSSAAKGETLEDTIKVINQYKPAVIVMRHHETGAAKRAAAVSEAAIINAGDGKGEHPTQALLDLYTIRQKHGRLDNLQIVIGGDLAHGRTARSLAKMLALYPDNSIRFVSTPELAIGTDIKEHLHATGTIYEEADDDLQTTLKYADVVYWTRLQTERLEDSTIASSYVIDERAMGALPKHAIVLHPLPRVGEISPLVDDDPRAAYFEQAGNGMYVRMAIIDSILGSS